MSEQAPQQYRSHLRPGPPASGGLLPGGPDRPTPLGLGLAGTGLLLLAIGSLLPQVSLGGADADEVGGFGLETAGAGLPGLPPALILVVLVGWAAAGIAPNLRWAAKLGGIGLAAITVAAALHPVIELNAVFDGDVWESTDVSASAGGGIWLFILAAALLAASIFLMRWAPPKQPVAHYPRQQYQQPPQGAQPTVQQPAAPHPTTAPGAHPGTQQTFQQPSPQQGDGWPGTPPQQ